jgi:hypothetical protein
MLNQMCQKAFLDVKNLLNVIMRWKDRIERFKKNWNSFSREDHFWLIVCFIFKQISSQFFRECKRHAQVSASFSFADT